MFSWNVKRGITNSGDRSVTKYIVYTRFKVCMEDETILIIWYHCGINIFHNTLLVRREGIVKEYSLYTCENAEVMDNP